MGFYVETVNTFNKAQQIVNAHGGKIVRKPAKFSDIPEDKAIIVVVDNGMFEAAALAYDNDEFNRFMRHDDERPKQFVMLDKTTAHKLAGYHKR